MRPCPRPNCNAELHQRSMQPLSPFGEERIDVVARRKAKEVDSRNEDWRYHAELLLGVVQFGLGLSFLFGCLGVLYALVTGSVELQLVVQTVLTFVAAIAFGKASKAVANPDVRVGS